MKFDLKVLNERLQKFLNSKDAQAVVEHLPGFQGFITEILNAGSDINANIVEIPGELGVIIEDISVWIEKIAERGIDALTNEGLTRLDELTMQTEVYNTFLRKTIDAKFAETERAIEILKKRAPGSCEELEEITAVVRMMEELKHTHLHRGAMFAEYRNITENLGSHQ